MKQSEFHRPIYLYFELLLTDEKIKYRQNISPMYFRVASCK